MEQDKYSKLFHQSNMLHTTVNKAIHFMNESNSLHIYSYQRSKYINLLQGSSRFTKYNEKSNINSEYAKIFSLFLILLIKTIFLL